MRHYGLVWMASIAMMSGVAQAAPAFSVSPATPDGPVASDLDLAWQGLASAAPASLGVTITEFDFELLEAIVVGRFVHFAKQFEALAWILEELLG